MRDEIPEAVPVGRDSGGRAADSAGCLDRRDGDAAGTPAAHGVCACGWTATVEGRWCADCYARWLWDNAVTEEVGDGGDGSEA